MTYDLRHSPLRLPHDRMKVTGKKSLRTHDGEAFTATLRLDNKVIGTIENQGTGGDTRFHPGRSALTYQEQIKVWNELVTGSEFTRDSVTFSWKENPKEVDTEYVADALVVEFEISKWLAEAAAAGQGALRSFSPSLGMSDTYIPYRTPEGYRPEHDAALIEHATKEELMEGDIWQVWTGSAWKDLTTVPPAAG